MPKHLLCLFIIGIVFSVAGCEKVNRDAAELTVDFSWEGVKPCGWGNPEIQINGVPENTKFLILFMYDHGYSHDLGTVKVPYTGNGFFAEGTFKEFQGPCPTWNPGRYEITIKAVDEKGVVIGIGSKERFFPEKE